MGDDFKKAQDPSVLTALAATQAAATSGDGQAFATAQGSVRSAVEQPLLRATYNYLNTGGDAGKRSEGESFCLTVAPIVKKAAPMPMERSAPRVCVVFFAFEDRLEHVLTPTARDRSSQRAPSERSTPSAAAPVERRFFPRPARVGGRVRTL